MIKVSKVLRHSVIAVLAWAAVVWIGSGSAFAAAVGERALLAKYPVIKAQLEKNPFGAPIFIDSREGERTVDVDMYGVLSYPFAVVKDALRYPPNWCEITSLHINIKACTSSKIDDRWLLTLYNGRKYYQAPADAFQLKLKFWVRSESADFLDVALSADQGPLYTKDHRIIMEAAPLDAHRTFVHFGYSYSYGSMAKMAIKTYYATIAHGKIGFSVLPGKDGKFYYVDGVRGSIERGTVRYFLAVETFIDTLNRPAGERFEDRLSRWFELTSRYPKQLKEMTKQEYLAMKRKEHGNQVVLQEKEG